MCRTSMEAVLGQGGGAQLNKYSNIGLNKGNIIIIILVWSQYIILVNMPSKKK